MNYNVKIKQICDECLDKVRELNTQIDILISKMDMESNVELCQLVGKQEAYYDIHIKLCQLLEQEEQ